jgi:hypothetical protein
MGDTTLTINGNEFTTSDGRTGRITTSRSKGYTAVALQVNGTDPNTPSSIISLRAKKNGKKLTLTPVAGSTKQCTFTPSQTPSPSPSPEASPSPEPSPTPSGSPRPRPRPSPGASPSPSPTECRARLPVRVRTRDHRLANRTERGSAGSNPKCEPADGT